MQEVKNTIQKAEKTNYFSLLEKASFTGGYSGLDDWICPSKEPVVYTEIFEKRIKELYEKMSSEGC